MRIAASIYVFRYQPDGCSAETARVCPSARPDAAQGAEQHVDRVFAIARPTVLFPRQDAAE